MSSADPEARIAAMEAEIRRLRALVYGYERNIEQVKVNLTLVSDSRDQIMQHNSELYEQLRIVEARWRASETRARRAAA